MTSPNPIQYAMFCKYKMNVKIGIGPQLVRNRIYSFAILVKVAAMSETSSAAFKWSEHASERPGTGSEESSVGRQ